FDIIHNHYDFLPLTYARLVTTPVVTTIHGFSSDRIKAVYRRYAVRVAYVSISEADRDPDLPYIATVYHGIDLSEFTPRDRPGRGIRRGRPRGGDRRGRSSRRHRSTRRASARRGTIQSRPYGRRLPARVRAGSLGRAYRMTQRFDIGVNYWPASTAMRWWRRF